MMASLVSRASPVPDCLLERYALGELPDEERRALARRISDDASLQRRLAELARDDAAVLARYPAAEMARAIELRRHRLATEESLARKRARRGKTVLLTAALAGAAAVVMLAIPMPTSIDAPAPPEVTRAKGPPELFVHRVDGATQIGLSPGDRVAAGDTLQVSYRTPEPRHGVVLSVDGRGTVTVHFPEGTVAGALRPGGLTELDHSYELDDAPALECFFLVTSREPFDVAPVLAAGAALGAALARGERGDLRLPLPAELEQSSLLLRKESR